LEDEIFNRNIQGYFYIENFTQMTSFLGSTRRRPMKVKDKAALLQTMQNKAKTTKRNQKERNRIQRPNELQENWVV